MWKTWTGRIAGVLLIATGGAVSAQETGAIVYYEPHSGFWDVFDASNPGRYARSDENPHDVLESKTRGGRTITWVVTYDDVDFNTNFGWDDLTEGADRRATLLEVLDYVSSILNESPATPIHVHWNTSTNSPMGSTLASMGTFFFTSNGFSSGFAQSHITTGVDPFAGVADIEGQVNFGRVWNSETDAPAGNEFDLYSVVLHEITHGLGVASLLESNGTSGISGGDPGKYSFLDRFMAADDVDPVGTGATRALFGASPDFLGTTGDLISDRLVYTGTNTVSSFGSNPRIYSPNPFNNGSSLSHWDFSTGSPVMLPSIAAGVQKRTYLPFEVANLIDLGYPNAADVVVVDPNNIYVDFTAGTNGAGTEGSPFNNLASALSAVAADGTIHIDTGTSSETFTGGSAINQSVTLINETPGGGVVQIGTP